MLVYERETSFVEPAGRLPTPSDQEPLVLASPRLTAAGFRHAFFTRRGGVSQGPYATLNLSATGGDEPGAVAENLRRAALVLGVPPSSLYTVSQVHGAVTVTVDGSEPAAVVRAREADAIVGRGGPFACGVRVADCVPILLGDPASGVVAAVHAGWRGIVANVLGAALAAMHELGAVPARTLAAIGPHISVERFEVGEEVAEALVRAVGAVDIVRRDLGQRPHVDLGRAALTQIVAAGVAPAHIDWLRACTFGDSERFYSYRRDGAVGGRHLAAIVPLYP